MPLRRQLLLLVMAAVAYAACQHSNGGDCMAPHVEIDASSVARYWRPGARFTACADRTCTTYPYRPTSPVPGKLFVTFLPIDKAQARAVSLVVTTDGTVRFSARSHGLVRSADGSGCAAGSILMRVDSSGGFHRAAS